MIRLWFFIYTAILSLLVIHSSAQTQLPFSTQKNGISLSSPYVVFSLQKNGDLIVGGKSFKVANSIELNGACKKSFCLKAQFNSASTWIFKDSELFLLNEKNQSLLFESRMNQGQIELLSDLPKNGLVKVCMSSFSKTEEILFCTSSLNLETGKPVSQKLQVIVNNAKSPLSGSIALNWNESFQFLAQAQSGSLMVRTLVPNPTLYQAFETDSKDIQVTHYGALSGAQVSKNLDRGKFWQHTIGDLRNYQTDIIKKQDPYIHFQSGLGILFSSQLLYNQLPLASEIITLKTPHSLTTYSPELQLRINVPEGYKITSSENSYSAETQIWKARTPEVYALNSPSLELTRPDGRTQYFVHPEIYRAYSTYLAARVGLSVASDSSFSALGDFSFWHWFENPLGHSRLFSHQRWGFNSTFVQSSVSASKHQVLSGNLIYRFTPGTVERTETLGLTFGASNIKYLEQPALSFAGVGLIWSRSLPQWFNSIFGWTELLRKPKWTDFEIMYHSASADPKVTGAITQVRATARIELSKATYFDAGWGVLGINYTDLNENKQGALFISRGYFGLGYRF